jgi:hypothetical protein
MKNLKVLSLAIFVGLLFSARVTDAAERVFSAPLIGCDCASMGDVVGGLMMRGRRSFLAVSYVVLVYRVSRHWTK